MTASGPARPQRVFVSYSHDSPAHKDRVLALCDRLRHDGVDADLDQYVEAPPEGWPRWTLRQIEAADFVLVVCTETYRRRFDGAEETGRGLGAIWEGAVLTQVLYDAAAASGKLVPVVFVPEDEAHIPTVLRGMARYDLSSETGYEELYRRLTGQPATPRPDLGTVVALPPRTRASDFPPTPPTPPTPTRRRWWPWLAAVGALAVALSWVGYFSFHPAGKIETVGPVGPSTPVRSSSCAARSWRPTPAVRSPASWSACRSLAARRPPTIRGNTASR